MKFKQPFVVRYIVPLLTLILFVKIGGYFSIVEERSVNQVFKIISRVGMTGLILVIYWRLKKIGCVPAFRYENILAPLLYIAYLLLGLASILWSSDPVYSSLQLSMTVESAVFVFIFMRVVMLINKYFPEQQIDLVKLFTWAIFPIMIIFILGAMIEPDTFYRGMRGGEEKRLGGWIMNPNELGMLSSIGAATAYLNFQNKRGKVMSIIMLLAAVVILALTSSRSSAIGFLLIMFLLILKSENRRLKTVMFVLAGCAVPVIIDQVIFKSSGGIEEVMSMTGRLPFWKALLEEGIVREPFLGYGFMRINYTDYFQGFNTYPGKMTHNTFMQVLMNLGFIGLFIAFWQFVQTIRNFLVDKERIYRRFFVAVFIPITINSFTEFGFFGEANYAILFYQFLIALFVIKTRAASTGAEKAREMHFYNRYKAQK